MSFILQWVNFLILAVVVFIFARKKLVVYFRDARITLEAQMNAASEKLESVKAQVQAARNQLEGFEAHANSTRAEFERALDIERKRIEEENARSMSKLVRDSELRIKSETDRAREALSKELLTLGLRGASDALLQTTDQADKIWTEQVLRERSENDPQQKAKYASS